MKQTALQRSIREYTKALKQKNTLMVDAEKLLMGFTAGWQAARKLSQHIKATDRPAESGRRGAGIL